MLVQTRCNTTGGKDLGLTDNQWCLFKLAMSALLACDLAGQRTQCSAQATWSSLASWRSNVRTRQISKWDDNDGPPIEFCVAHEKRRRDASGVMTVSFQTASFLRLYALLTGKQRATFKPERVLGDAELQWHSAVDDRVFVADTLPDTDDDVFHRTDAGRVDKRHNKETSSSQFCKTLRVWYNRFVHRMYRSFVRVCISASVDLTLVGVVCVEALLN